MTQDSSIVDYDSQEHIYEYKPQEQQQEHTQNGSLLISLLKSVKIGSDLSKMSNPVTFDKGISNLERMADIMFPTDAIVGLYKNPCPKQRMLNIVRSILAGQSPATRYNVLGNEKPYNPILGEEFNCHWNHPDGSQTFCHAEQVSHHPPHSAVYLYNRPNNYIAETSIVLHSKFTGNKITAGAKGMFQIHLQLSQDTKETYTAVFPSVHVRGLFFGKGCFELGDELVVTCEQTNLEARLHFKKGQKVTGHIASLSEKKKKQQHFYSIEGNMLDILYITNLETNEKSVLIDTEQYKLPAQKHVKPVSKQKDNESRKVWHNVTYHIKQKDYDNASKYKKIVEDKQRTLAKHAKENKIEHVPAHFSNRSESNVYRFIKHSDIFNAELEGTQVDDDLD
jgi:hypothetical protein